ncbi:MAG: DUF3419 family protein [Candidatus Woesearchaeota archaeon]
MIRNIIYSIGWDDLLGIRLAIPKKKKLNFFTITASGDVALDFLLLNPNLVVSIDKNMAQNALLYLKIVAIKKLEYEEFLSLLGILNKYDRMQIYKKISYLLPAKYGSFLNKNKSLIKAGIIFNGVTENYFKRLRIVLNLFFKKELIEIKKGNMLVQQKVAKKIDKSIIFRILSSKFFISLFFSRLNISKYKIFRNIHLTRNIKKQFESREIINNPFLSVILFGKYFNNIPSYLNKKNFLSLKKNIHKLHIYDCNVTDFFNKYNYEFDFIHFTDVFDWLPKKIFINTILKSSTKLHKNGRIFYKFFLNGHKKYKKYFYNHNLIFLKELSNHIEINDRVSFYKDFMVLEKTK